MKKHTKKEKNEKKNKNNFFELKEFKKNPYLAIGIFLIALVFSVWVLGFFMVSPTKNPEKRIPPPGELKSGNETSKELTKCDLGEVKEVVGFYLDYLVKARGLDLKEKGTTEEKYYYVLQYGIYKDNNLLQDVNLYVSKDGTLVFVDKVDYYSYFSNLIKQSDINVDINCDNNKNKVECEIEKIREVFDKLSKKYGGNISYEGYEKVSDFYKITFSAVQYNQRTKMELYLTPDGKEVLRLLEKYENIKKEVLNLMKALKNGIKLSSKKEVPELKLYVMSYCPFGNSFEEMLYQTLKTFIDNNEINITPYYIISKDPTGKYSSMHGNAELEEDLIEKAVYNLYGQAKWLEVVHKVNEECYGKEDANCGYNVLKKLGLDENEVREYIENNREKMLKDEYENTVAKGIGASPTMFVNGDEITNNKYSRDPNVLWKTVCEAFKEKPDECKKEKDFNFPTVLGTC